MVSSLHTTDNPASGITEQNPAYILPIILPPVFLNGIPSLRIHWRESVMEQLPAYHINKQTNKDGLIQTLLTRDISSILAHSDLNHTHGTC